jgi:hypothetical protein
VSQSNDEIRAVRVMVDELRALPTPELPWDAIEQRLLARLDRDGQVLSFPVRRGLGSNPLVRVFGLAAAAAAITLGVTHLAGLGDAPYAAAPRVEAVRVAAAPGPRHVDAAAVASAPGPAGQRGERDLGQLAVGDVVEAGAAPVTFSRAGLVAWTLDAGSVARVRSLGDAGTGVGHMVALERGRIAAQVVPRDASEGLVEAFIVEVQGTRVAVHGTAFSVTVEPDRVIVDVEHGAVAVGPAGHVGATTGHLLVGPARASFSLDGGRTARMLARPAALAAALEPAPAAPAPVPARALSLGEPPAPSPAAPIPAAHPSLPVVVAAAPPPAPEPAAVPAPAPAAEPAPLTVATIRGRLDRCFRSTHDLGALAVEMSVSSTLRLQLNADGTVLSARFDPPLKPEFVSCAGGAIAGRFAEGGRSLDIPVSFKP